MGDISVAVEKGAKSCEEDEVGLKVAGCETMVCRITAVMFIVSFYPLHKQ